MTINDNNMFMEPNLLSLEDYSPTWTAAAWPDDDTSQEDTHDVSTTRANKRTLAPNLTRRSHKKSRAGCFSCKSRKIKCGEEKPTCKNCALKLSECVYPSRQPKRDSMATTRRPSTLLTSCPFTPQFSMTDMLFFHHFLTLAYPHLPLGNDDVWLRDIPQFAQQHTYLMHAILALGASHLDRLSPVSGTHEKDALMHRGHAINGLNRALAQSEHTGYGEADAMLATCYALTFQSTYMNDGLQDFITFVRGCALATGKIRDENAPTAFNLMPNQHVKIMEERFRDLPTVNPSIISLGLEAIQPLQSYVHNEAEHAFYGALHDILTGLQRSSAEGYMQFVEMYSVWYDMAHESFKIFLDNTNSTIQLLLGFFIGVQMVMVPMTQHEWTERSSAAASSQLLVSMREWLDGVESRVPPELRYHLSWSRRMVDIVVAQVEGLPFDGPPILHVRTDNTILEDTLQ